MCAVLSLPPALAHRDFRRLWSSMLCSGVAMQMVAVAVGWQVYSIHGKAFDLGLIGLAEFLPVLLLALPAGQLADRLPRVTLVAICGLRGRSRRRAPPRRDDRRRAPAVAVPRARRAHGHDRRARQPGRPLADTGDRPGRAARPARSPCARSRARPRRSAGRRSAGCSSRSGPRRSTRRGSCCSSPRRSSCCGSRTRRRTRRSGLEPRAARRPARRHPVHPLDAR